MTAGQKKNLLLIATLIMIAINLRPAITGVGPLIYEIRIDTGLSNSLLGLLTTLPLVAFSICSVLTAVLSRKIGVEATMAIAFLLITTGIFSRVIPSTLALLLGTAVIGMGIAVGNVLLPGIAKRYFPNRFGKITGLYASMMSLGAAVASGVSVPLSEGLNLGWRWALGVWGFLSLAAFLAWLPRMKNNKPAGNSVGFLAPLRDLGKSDLAWSISIFMGLQSLTFYVCVAWLPEILIEQGMSPSQAGWMLFLSQVVGVFSTMFIPAWAEKQKDQKLPVILILASEIVSILGLILPPNEMILTILWVCLLGISLGSSYGIVLLMIGLRTRDSDTANELSGMSQSVGYTLAATGPVLFGILYDWTGTWLLPLCFLLLVSLVKLWSGLRSAVNRII